MLMEQLKEDYDRLLKNAYAYYNKDSHEYKDASEIKRKKQTF